MKNQYTNKVEPIQEKLNPPSARDRGLTAANNQNWPTALVELNLAARQGYLDLVVLDAFGEAAYRTSTPEALAPYQNLYKYPSLATHMARAFLMLGDTTSTLEFLNMAQDSALKAALEAMLEVGTDIHKTAGKILPVATKYPDLYYPEYWRTLAPVADALGNHDLTSLSERRSKALAYKDPNIHFNQALRLLGKGEFRAAWRLYDWRLVPGAHQNNRTELGDMSMWEGENLGGKTLMILLEQGLGDCIFALRYIRPLQERGATIEMVVRKTLIPLVQSSFPEIKIHIEEDVCVSDYWNELPQADFWVYALSIPYRAGLWRPMGCEKYLNASEDQLKKVKAKINNPLNLPIFTINWHGRIDTDSDRTRAFSVDEFLQVTGILEKPCIVISLQKEALEEEVALLLDRVTKAGGQLINTADDLVDFGVTAAWISASDRLLTCDTSVAHVGGALGHPSTVYVRNLAIWQWRPLDCEDLPNGGSAQALWYKSILLQSALAPEISWLFNTLDKNKEKKNDNNNTELQPTNHGPARRQRTFMFAGRTPTEKSDGN
jgi:hypothetical protein